MSDMKIAKLSYEKLQIGLLECEVQILIEALQKIKGYESDLSSESNGSTDPMDDSYDQGYNKAVKAITEEVINPALAFIEELNKEDG